MTEFKLDEDITSDGFDALEFAKGFIAEGARQMLGEEDAAKVAIEQGWRIAPPENGVLVRVVGAQVQIVGGAHAVAIACNIVAYGEDAHLTDHDAEWLDWEEWDRTVRMPGVGNVAKLRSRSGMSLPHALGGVGPRSFDILVYPGTRRVKVAPRPFEYRLDDGRPIGVPVGPSFVPHGFGS